jgi:hypothetical protein
MERWILGNNAKSINWEQLLVSLKDFLWEEFWAAPIADTTPLGVPCVEMAELMVPKCAMGPTSTVRAVSVFPEDFLMELWPAMQAALVSLFLGAQSVETTPYKERKSVMERTSIKRHV